MLVDEERIAMSPAVELSYLSEDEQAISPMNRSWNATARPLTLKQ